MFLLADLATRTVTFYETQTETLDGLQVVAALAPTRANSNTMSAVIRHLYDTTTDRRNFNVTWSFKLR